MKKLLFVASLLVSSFAFTACEEEVILPTNETGTTSGSGGDGAEQTDPGQWD